MRAATVVPDSGPVLVLGGADVQAEAALAGRALGREVHLLAAECGDAAQAAAHRVVEMDLTDVDAVRSYARRIGARALCSVGSDLAVPVVAEVAAALQLPSPVSLRTAQLCGHKSRVRALLRDAPGAVECAVAGRGARMPLPPPVVVKPDDGQGQRGLSLVTSEAEFGEALDHALAHSRSGRAAVEEFVPGPEISVNGFLVGGDLVFVGVSDRLTWPDELGIVRAHRFPSSVAGASEVGEAVAVVDAACRRLGLHDGPVYAQMIVGPLGVRLVEITPRLDGCHLWRLWRAVTGVDLLAATVATACGAPAPDRLRAGHPVLRPVCPPHHAGTWTLEFDCLPPGTVVPAPPERDDPGVVEQAHYYVPGAVVRTVNGRREKTGWTLRQGVVDAVGASPGPVGQVPVGRVG